MELDPIYKFYKELDFKDYIEIAFRRKRIVITFFLLVVFIAGVRAHTTDPIYRATTQILIEEDESGKLPTLQEIYAMRPSSETYYETQYRILKSRSLAERVAEKINLMASPEFQYEDEEADPASILLGMLEIKPVRRTHLVDVSVESRNPELAATIANAVAGEYIEQGLEERMATTEDAVGWLGDEIKELKAKVEISERSLQEYREKDDLVSLEDSQNIIVQRLAQLNTAATDAKAKRLAAEAKYSQIQEAKRASRSLETIPSIRDDELVRGLKATLSQKEATLSELLKRYKEKHPKIIELRSELKTINERIDTEIDKVIDSITSEYEESRTNEDSVLKALTEQEKQALRLNELSIEYNTLKRYAETDRKMYEELLAKMKETDISGRLKQANARIIDKAEVPRFPIKPNKTRDMGMACVIGLMLGAGVAFLLEYLDDTVRSPRDIEKYLQLPVLGHIPIIKARGPDVAMYTSMHPRDEVSEALRTFKTNVNFTLNFPTPHTLLMTSTIPSEGKTSVSINLSIVMAQGGSKTLIVDADMRHPSVSKALKIDNSIGLRDYLSGTQEFDSVLKTTSVPNLSVIPAGPASHSPIELLGSTRVAKFIEEARTRFDKIIIDSPPVIAVSDALLMAKLVDGVIIVIKGAEASKDSILTAARKLENIDARILGTALNNIDLAREKYYYSYYHGARTKKKKKRGIGGGISKSKPRGDLKNVSEFINPESVQEPPVKTELPAEPPRIKPVEPPKEAPPPKMEFPPEPHPRLEPPKEAPPPKAELPPRAPKVVSPPKIVTPPSPAPEPPRMAPPPTTGLDVRPPPIEPKRPKMKQQKRRRSFFGGFGGRKPGLRPASEMEEYPSTGGGMPLSIEKVIPPPKPQQPLEPPQEQIVKPPKIKPPKAETKKPFGAKFKEKTAKPPFLRWPTGKSELKPISEAEHYMAPKEDIPPPKVVLPPEPAPKEPPIPKIDTPKVIPPKMQRRTVEAPRVEPKDTPPIKFKEKPIKKPKAKPKKGGFLGGLLGRKPKPKPEAKGSGPEGIVPPPKVISPPKPKVGKPPKIAKIGNTESFRSVDKPSETPSEPPKKPKPKIETPPKKIEPREEIPPSPPGKPPKIAKIGDIKEFHSPKAPEEKDKADTIGRADSYNAEEADDKDKKAKPKQDDKDDNSRRKT